MRRLVLIAAFLVTFFAVVTSVRSAAALSSDELARQVEEKYRSLKSLSMDFVKITRSDIFETESKIKGKMLLKNPEKFKIETKDERSCRASILFITSISSFSYPRSNF